MPQNLIVQNLKEIINFVGVHIHLMGNCFSKKEKRQRAYRVTNPQEDDENDSPIEGDSNKKKKIDSGIVIRRNPLTNKLQGIPKKWIQNGICNPKIVEMGKLVESNDDNQRQGPDQTISDGPQDGVIQIEGTVGTSSFLSQSISNMELDENAAYGIKNLPEHWAERLRGSEIVESKSTKESQIIMDLIRSQTFHEQKIQPRKLISADQFTRNVENVEIFYRNPSQNYAFLKQLGKGGMCKVYEAKSKYDNGENHLAVRIINNKKPAFLLKIQEEIALMKACECENIVKHKETYYYDNSVFMFVDFMNWGSLTSVIENCRDLPFSIMAYILSQILQGLLHLHSKKLIHRDLKSDNILVNTKGEIKIADFGFAAQLTIEKQSRQSVVGTPAWMAPQLIRKLPYNQKVDIWSLGIILYQFLEKQPPFLHMPPFKAMYLIASKDPPKLKKKVPDEMRDFYNKCLQKDPQNRLTSAQLLKHPFISQYSVEKSRQQFVQFLKSCK